MPNNLQFEETRLSYNNDGNQLGMQILNIKGLYVCLFTCRFGRLPVTIVTFVGMAITMIGTGLSHNFAVYCFVRFASGVFTIANFTTVFILGQ